LRPSAASGVASHVRPPAVAGAFYPASAVELAGMVADLLEAARVTAPARASTPLGLLVPHAGLQYSGVVAAAGWHQLARARPAPTIVLLGTNHAAGWLAGVGVWESGGWLVPTGEIAVDEELAEAIVALGPPFTVDRQAHLAEHSIEVQLPLVQAVSDGARVVPLAVSAGRGPVALEAGRRLGELLARRSAAGQSVVLAISTDMAHYPPVAACRQVTDALTPAIVAVDALALIELEDAVRDIGLAGLACGMCGIEPAVLGLAALRAWGARYGSVLDMATSADAGGPDGRTVGYLAARFDS
jgi:AmmeMemoRadiSam system protein B